MNHPVLGPQPLSLEDVPESRAQSGRFAASLQEIISAIASFSIWGPISLDDVTARYRRTILGPLWLIIPQAMFIAGIYTLHRQTMSAGSTDFLPYLAISLPLWALLTALAVDTTSCFLSAKGFIDSYALPLAIHIVRSVSRAYIVFAHLLIVYFVVELWAHKSLPVTMVAAAPALAILAVFGLGAGLALAPLGTRYRDVPPALGAVMMLGFVLSPVFWVPTEAQKLSPMVYLNPFYYLLEVVRQPMLGSWGEPHIWAIATMISVSMFVVGVLVYVRQRPTVIYWL
jgi:ABC-type polysaccharide/polyol phosphate export permease